MEENARWKKWGLRLASATPRVTSVHDGAPPHALRTSLGIALSLLLAARAGQAEAAVPPTQAATSAASGPADASVGGARVLVSQSLGFAGRAGSAVLGAERLLSISAWSASSEAKNAAGKSVPGPSASGLGVSLLSSSAASASQDPYRLPRLTLDVFVLPTVTLGASLGYGLDSGDKQPSPNSSVNVPMPRSSAVVGAVRAGWVAMFSPEVGLWLRAGASFAQSSLESDERIEERLRRITFTWSQVALSVEPTLVVCPVEHFGLTLGFMGDIPLTSSTEEKADGAGAGGIPTVEGRYNVARYGFAAGLLGYF